MPAFIVAKIVFLVFFLHFSLAVDALNIWHNEGDDVVAGFYAGVCVCVHVCLST